MTYQPIENYGLIGNMRTCALVGMNGSVDWYCYPYFDSPSVFAAILDDNKGGRFQICPADIDEVTCKQLYWPDTNVLITRFLSAQGIGEVVDYMPVPVDAPHSGPGCGGELFRRVTVTHGTMRFRVVCQPAFNYGRDRHTIRIEDNGVSFHTDDQHFGLSSNIQMAAIDEHEDGAVTATFTLREGESAVFLFSEVDADASCQPYPSDAEADTMFDTTINYWRRWLSQCTYTGRWREAIYRSALAMKLMTFEPTGAIVAAPTTSLPEWIGGARNWDYRYTWLRDAAFTLYAFIRIGFTGEAAAFMDWMIARAHEQDPNEPLQPLYGIDGRHNLTEFTLDHFEGYMGSGPVRVGNAADKQFQLDIYGPVLDAAYLYNKYGTFISYDLWQELRKLVNWVCDNWERKDLGIWEIRAEPQDFVYSKLMAWVAVDRGVRLADKRSFPAEYDRWREVRNRIYESIMDHGWSDDLNTFVQYYGADQLDAANLIMPLVFFVSATDPRMKATMRQTMQPIDEGGLMSGGMVYRYDYNRTSDGLDDPEGAFNMTTFWLVEALARGNETERARQIFERMLGYANHLGLFAEQTGLRGEALGNFPQAFTHLGLISAAFNLNRALDER